MPGEKGIGRGLPGGRGLQGSDGFTGEKGEPGKIICE